MTYEPWLMELLGKLREYEDMHSHADDDWACFKPSLDLLPPDMLVAARAWEAARQHYGRVAP